jgi:hypothetical protein
MKIQLKTWSLPHKKSLEMLIPVELENIRPGPNVIKKTFYQFLKSRGLESDRFLQRSAHPSEAPEASPILG